MTVSSGVIEPFLNWNLDAADVPLLNGLRIQIVPTFEDLYRARRHQYAAFIAAEALLVVWDDEPTHLLQRAKTIEAGLLDFVWKAANDNDAQTEKGVPGSNSSEFELDEETGLMGSKERPILLYNCFLVACSLCLLTVLIGLGYVKIADELAELHKWTSLVFIIMTPINAFLTLVSEGCLSSCIITDEVYSSSPRSSSLLLPKSLAPSNTSPRTQNISLPSRHHGSQLTTSHTSPSNAPSTKKGLTL
jgi:hypothetical protein